MSSANNDNFTSFFPIWLPFLSSCLIAVASTFSAMLNKSSESGHLCLVLDLKGKSCWFLPISMKLAVFLSYVDFIVLSWFPLC